MFIKMKQILPQANTLSTILQVFVFAGLKENCTKEHIASVCNFDLRQADYYLGANIFLGLLDEHCKLTELGKEILCEENRDDYKRRVYEVIISHPLISKFFAHLVLYPEISEEEMKDYVSSLTKQYYTYSDSVIKRRSEGILGWCISILEYIKTNPKFLK